jgi:small-conductance mechanosensitive channel
MRTRQLVTILLGIVIAIALCLNSPIWAQQQPSPTESPTAPLPGTVLLDDRDLFTLSDPLDAPTVQERADWLSNRLQKLAEDPTFPPSALQVGEQQGLAVVFYGTTVVMRVSPQDAIAVNMEPEALAERYAETIQDAITTYRQTNAVSATAQVVSTWERFKQFVDNLTTLTVRGGSVSYGLAIAYTIMATAILAGVLFALKLLFPQLFRLIRVGQRRRWFALHLYKIEILSAKQVSRVLWLLTKMLRLLLTGVSILLYAIIVLNFYPLTQKLGRQLFDYTQDLLGQFLQAILGYLPNLIVIIVIVMLTYYTLRITKPIFNQLDKETIKINGFYPEWAEPTYRLLELLILAIAAVLCFPYLPGFGSEAFQGLSIFLGVLVSLGSTTAIANGVAGVILIYTRAFRLGDYIAVGDARGEVEEKSILVTRIRTINNVIVTIPNAALIANNIQNYSISERDTGQPVILTTTVTLGYDVPWSDIYTALTHAAQRTPHVLADPAPAVWQTGLGDFSVSYEVRVYTDRPVVEPEILSNLHQNMQDACNAAGIEILSPTYSAVRDGNTSTIPENYLPADYKAPGFKLNPLGSLLQVDWQWQTGKTNGKSQARSNGKER